MNNKCTVRYKINYYNIWEKITKLRTKRTKSKKKRKKKKIKESLDQIHSSVLRKVIYLLFKNLRKNHI